ncbi:response regulator transcription factor [Paenibacillus wulumuqiensis]|uniref:response regulator transcription factor n=1 Tax=Paenibacillus wulumuqiensis TaxID=1567107 RepID=UPI000619665E|nr:response regulator transcription factor [Paenibacillus wulumuqiensis]
MNILLVDDHIGVAQGTKAILERRGSMKVTLLSCSGQVMEHLHNRQYDLILLDLYMPELNGMELAKLILDYEPASRIIIYTGFDIATHFNMMVNIGICGFISKSLPEEQMVRAIECAMHGDTLIPTYLFKQLRRKEVSTIEQPMEDAQEPLRDITLNEREQDILMGVAEGMTNRELSAKLLISQRAVEYVLTGVYNKLGVKSRTEALIKAKRYSLLSVSMI